MRYREYKKVDIPWLDEVPSHWEINKGKHVFEISTGKLDANQGELDGKYPFFTCSQKPRRINEYAFDCEALLVSGNGNVGQTQYYNGKFNAYQRVYVLNNIKHVETSFLKWYISNVLPIYVQNRYVGSVINFIVVGDLRSFPVLIPPKEEQEQIARFLDCKINEIDRLIGGYRNKIKYINLIKSQLIANEYMKSDEKIRLKMLLKNDMEYGLNISGDISGDFRYVRITDIDKNGNLKETDQQFVSNFDKKYILNKEDILFARSGATVGKTYYYKESDGNCAYAGYLIRARVNKDLVYPEYIYYFTQSEIYEEWKNSIFIQSTIQNINAEKYSNLLIPMFDKEVQEKVIKNCKLIINRIDKIEKNQAQQINNLQLLKQSLISDVVTGKIDLRNISIPEYDKVSDTEDDVILEESFNEEV